MLQNPTGRLSIQTRENTEDMSTDSVVELLLKSWVAMHNEKHDPIGVESRMSHPS